MSGKVKIAFICTHNSCRSQMAEAICKLKASDVFEAYSAGTEPRKEINSDAIRIMQKIYNINMLESHRPKLLSEIPHVDIVVTMGCGVQCPYLPCKHREDWGLEDPSGQPDMIELTAKVIEDKVLDLKTRILSFKSADIQK